MSDTVESLKITDLAHAKILLHAMQYSTSSIYGILIGNYKGSELQIQDSIPVCHSAPTKPILDMAFRMVDSHINNNIGDGSQIVGWYTANERYNDLEPNQAALRIVGSMASQISSEPSSSDTAEPVLLMLNPTIVADMIEGITDSTNPLKAYGRDVRKQQWIRSIPEESFVMTSQQRDVLEKVCQMEDTDIPIYDFECHLESENATEIKRRDWLENSMVAQKMK